MNMFTLDAETDGLYGPVWAIGAIVEDQAGVEIARFMGQIDLDVYPLTEQWVVENVAPHVDLPVFSSREALLGAFWDFWMAHKAGAICLADCGAPVEAALFRACVEMVPAARQWDGPYPLHEVASVLLARGLDPDLDRVQFSGLEGLQKHNPVDDARASSACFRRAMTAGVR